MEFSVNIIRPVMNNIQNLLDFLGFLFLLTITCGFVLLISVNQLILKIIYRLIRIDI